MNAESLSQIVERLRALWELHVPAQYHPPALPAAALALILGIGIAVLGARVARGGATLVFACIGGLAAWSLQSHVNWSPALVLAGGMLAGALAGFVLFRVWVGLAAAAVLAALALGVYGNHHIAPHFVEYDAAHNFNGAFVIPEAPASDTSPGKLDRLHAWWQDFWLYVQSKESDVNTWVAGVALVSAVMGFAVGSLLPRLTLILGSGCLGTALVLAGIAVLAKHSSADLYQAALANPRVIGIVSLVLLGVSLLLQGLLTRQTRPAAAPTGGPS